MSKISSYIYIYIYIYNNRYSARRDYDLVIIVEISEMGLFAYQKWDLEISEWALEMRLLHYLLEMSNQNSVRNEAFAVAEWAFRRVTFRRCVINFSTNSVSDCVLRGMDLRTIYE